MSDIKERAEELLSEKGGFWAMKPAESFREIIRELLTELAITTSSLAMHKTIKKESQAQVEALRVREVKLVSGLEYYANDSAWSDMGDYDGWCFDGLGSSAAQQALATTSPEESE